VFLKIEKEEEKPFTEGEIKYLEKIIKDTYVSHSILLILLFSKIKFAVMA
jgi:hypothetical protein